MKVVDAFWEKRNLGVDVMEIQCDNEDTCESLQETLSGVSATYSVCKIPSSRTDLLSVAQILGYHVVELSMGMDGVVSRLEMPPMFKRFLPYVDVKPADLQETEWVLQEIAKGEIFKTDRIALDPHFGPQIAGKRYSNWARDILAKNGHLYIANYKDSPVAFGINQDKEAGVSDAVMGGILDPVKGKGLGFLALYSNYVGATEHGNKRIVTHVSANNPAIINLHLHVGYQISEFQYVLVKHL